MIRNESPREISLGPTPADVPLTDLPTIDFTAQQLKNAEQIAHQRSKSCEDINGEPLYGERANQDAHLTGVVGGLAIAELYGGTIDRQVYEKGEDGQDLVFEGTTIDLKAIRTASLTRPDLIVPTDPTLAADYYYPVHSFDERCVRIIGNAPRGRVLSRDPEHFPGTTVNHVVPPAELFLPSEYQPLQHVEQQLFCEAELA